MRRVLRLFICVLTACSGGTASTSRDKETPIASDATLDVTEDTAKSGQLLGSATEGGALVFTIASSPGHGAVVVDDAASGAYTYTPAPNYAGTDAFTFTVKNDAGTSVAATVSITIAPVNDPPSLAGATLGEGPYDTNATLTVTPQGFVDVEGDPASYAYQWFVNDAAVSGATNATLSGASFDAFDEVFCRVTPNDGVDAGLTVDSNTLAIANTPPAILSVDIGEGPYDTNDVLSAVVVDVPDLDDDAVTYSYRWFKNGVAIASGGTSVTLDGAASFAKGDEIFCRVTPNDGTDAGQPKNSNTVTITNAPPALTSADLGVGPHYTNDVLAVEVSASDADGDVLSFSYQWFKDGTELVGATAATLDGATHFDKGDEIVCRVTASDGDESGAPADTSAIVIANSAPTVSSVGYNTLVDGSVSGLFAGSDVDGDPLSFSISTDSSDGTTLVLDAESGEFEFSPDPGFIGSSVVEFIASDGSDDSAPASAYVEVHGDERLVVAYRHVCAIKNDQSLWCWGAGLGGQLGNGALNDQGSAMRESLAASDWVVASGGADYGEPQNGRGFTCGIRAPGTLWCWGKDFRGALGNGAGAGDTPTPMQVGSDSTWTQVSGGYARSCAIRADSSLWCWGSDQEEPQQVGTGRMWRSVASGYSHTCALQHDGELYCFGSSNDYGQQGNGGTTSNSSPTREITLGRWKEVAAGIHHTCAIKEDDTLWCWGRASHGALGNTGSTNVPTPTQVGGGGTWLAVAAGSMNTCAVKSDHTMWCFGRNFFGQIGNGTWSSQAFSTSNVVSTPTKAGNDTDWSHTLAVGGALVCAMKTSGAVYCWGSTMTGFGDGTTQSSTVPIDTGASAAWLAWDARGRENEWQGMQCGCGVGSVDGKLYCWGDNRIKGTLGDDSSFARKEPYLISSATNWANVALNEVRNTCAVRTDGTRWCFGLPYNGGLGNGSLSGSTMVSTPTQADADTDWSPAPGRLTMGGASQAFGCAIKTNGTLWCWGTNAAGTLGVGDTTARASPTQESSGATTWTAVEAGYSHACALKSDGTLWCWGANTRGQLGRDPSTGSVCGTTPCATSPTQVSSATDWAQVAVGHEQTCARKTGGQVHCFGKNSDGSLGLGSSGPDVCGGTSCSFTPRAVAGTAWTDIRGGDAFCAKNTSGELYCFGNNTRGQAGNGTRTVVTAPTKVNGDTDWADVRPAGLYTCATKTNGDLFCFGVSRSAFGAGTAWRENPTPVLAP